MSLTDAPEAEGTTEPNIDTTGGAAGVSDYHAQIQSWYHMPPGDHLSPSSKSTYKSPYAPSTYVSPYAKHHAVSKLQSPPAELPPRQGPPLGEGPMESQSASGTSHRQPTHPIQTAIPPDPAPDPSVQSPQTDTTSGLQSPEFIIEPENGIAALPPLSGSQDRQRCGKSFRFEPSMAVMYPAD